jgi:aminocarboxymuconate-semialdehyde decarboxylase
MELLLDLFGSDRILLGSDYPFPLGEACPGKLIDSMDMKSSDKEAIFYKSALDWLAINEERFLL